MGHSRFNRGGGPLTVADAPHPMAAPVEETGLLARGLWGMADDGDVDESPVELEDGALPALTSRPGGQARARRDVGDRQVVSSVAFRGRYVRAVPAAGRWDDLAWAATVGIAARRGRGGRDGMVLSPRIDDLRRKQRVQTPGRLLFFVVDVSGSMGGELTALAKNVAVAVLRDAYIKRDRVAMVAFRQRSAELLFGPTNQVELVRRALDTLPCGGTTPLAMGLELANVVLRRALARDRGRRPTLILVSDGRANVGSQPGYAAVLAEVEAAARVLSEMEGLSRVFLDTTEAGKNDAPARHLVDLLGARRLLLSELDGAGQDPATLLSHLL